MDRRHSHALEDLLHYSRHNHVEPVNGTPMTSNATGRVK